MSMEEEEEVTQQLQNDGDGSRSCGEEEVGEGEGRKSQKRVPPHRIGPSAAPRPYTQRTLIAINPRRELCLKDTECSVLEALAGKEVFKRFSHHSTRSAHITRSGVLGTLSYLYSLLAVVLQPIAHSIIGNEQVTLGLTLLWILCLGYFTLIIAAQTNYAVLRICLRLFDPYFLLLQGTLFCTALSGIFCFTLSGTLHSMCTLVMIASSLTFDARSVLTKRSQRLNTLLSFLALSALLFLLYSRQYPGRCDYRLDAEAGLVTEQEVLSGSSGLSRWSISFPGVALNTGMTLWVLFARMVVTSVWDPSVCIILQDWYRVRETRETDDIHHSQSPDHAGESSTTITAHNPTSVSVIMSDLIASTTPPRGGSESQPPRRATDRHVRVSKVQVLPMNSMKHASESNSPRGIGDTGGPASESRKDDATNTTASAEVATCLLESNAASPNNRSDSVRPDALSLHSKPVESNKEAATTAAAAPGDCRQQIIGSASSPTTQPTKDQGTTGTARRVLVLTAKEPEIRLTPEESKDTIMRRVIGPARFRILISKWLIPLNVVGYVLFGVLVVIFLVIMFQALEFDEKSVLGSCLIACAVIIALVYSSSMNLRLAVMSLRFFEMRFLIFTMTVFGGSMWSTFCFTSWGICFMLAFIIITGLTISYDSYTKKLKLFVRHGIAIGTLFVVVFLFWENFKLGSGLCSYRLYVPLGSSGDDDENSSDGGVQFFQLLDEENAEQREQALAMHRLGRLGISLTDLCLNSGLTLVILLLRILYISYFTDPEECSMLSTTVLVRYEDYCCCTEGSGDGRLSLPEEAANKGEDNCSSSKEEAVQGSARSGGGEE